MPADNLPPSEPNSDESNILPDCRIAIINDPEMVAIYEAMFSKMLPRKLFSLPTSAGTIGIEKTHSYYRVSDLAENPNRTVLTNTIRLELPFGEKGNLILVSIGKAYDLPPDQLEALDKWEGILEDRSASFRRANRSSLSQPLPQSVLEMRNKSANFMPRFNDGVLAMTIDNGQNTRHLWPSNNALLKVDFDKFVAELKPILKLISNKIQNN